MLGAKNAAEITLERIALRNCIARLSMGRKSLIPAKETLVLMPEHYEAIEP
jgi:hypothetical protein